MKSKGDGGNVNEYPSLKKYSAMPESDVTSTAAMRQSSSNYEEGHKAGEPCVQ